MTNFSRARVQKNRAFRAASRVLKKSIRTFPSLAFSACHPGGSRAAENMRAKGKSYRFVRFGALTHRAQAPARSRFERQGGGAERRQRRKKRGGSPVKQGARPTGKRATMLN